MSLHARVQAFIAATPEGREPFDGLACDIARHQAALVPAVARLFEAEGVDAERLRDADAIPAVVTDAFRHRRIATHPEAQDTRVFETSGTSLGEEQRGRHPMRDLGSYVAGALAWGEAHLWPDLPPEELAFIGLVAPEDLAPRSSLTFMLARFAERMASASYHWDGETLDVAAVQAATTTTARPTLVAGTSFAFVHLLDSLGDTRLPLPPGSRVMQTGGFKGRSREIEATTLRRELAELFAIPEAMIVAEYGMTELSSQLYQISLRRHLGLPTPSGDPFGYAAPPWLRVTAVDPVSLQPVAPGEVGLARFVDLANVDSAVAIQTADRIRLGQGGLVELLGRAPGAPPRGCSLALEHLLS